MINGGKADIYSLGISIIKLIVPEEKTVRNILKFYDKHVNDEKQEFYKLFYIVKDMIHKDPNKRIDYTTII
jgi:hypothetical protein